MVDRSVLEALVANVIATNALGQVYSLTYSNNLLQSAIDPTGSVTTYNWDSLGHLAGIGDGLGNLTSFSYFTLPNRVPSLASVLQPQGGIFTYSYNSNNQVSSVTDQLGQVTTLVWNSSGLRSAAIDALGNRTSYSYTSTGQLASVQNPIGQLVTLVYDGLGRQIA